MPPGSLTTNPDLADPAPIAGATVTHERDEWLVSSARPPRAPRSSILSFAADTGWVTAHLLEEALRGG